MLGFFLLEEKDFVQESVISVSSAASCWLHTDESDINALVLLIILSVEGKIDRSVSTQNCFFACVIISLVVGS